MINITGGVEKESVNMDLDSKIRKIPNWPKPGILFYDVTTLFEDAPTFRYIVDKLCEPYLYQKVDKVVGIDARGFLLASTMAYKLNCGISIVRKKGKLPYRTLSATYEKEYGPDTVEMHQDTIKPGERVVIVDDLLATGGTMLATVDLVKQMGGDILGIEFIINLGFLPGLKKLKEQGHQVNYLIEYDSEEVKDGPAGNVAAKPIVIGLIGGSGLEDPEILRDFHEVEVKTPFGRPSSKLTIGEIQGRKVVIISRHGKDHSILPTKVPFKANLWALKQQGCTHILATTACGSLQQDYKPGDLVFIDQFIDNTKHRTLTFFENKVVHTPMAEPFCSDLRKVLADSAARLGLSFHGQGTMITIEGPRFSSKSEAKMFQSWGADVINMSTVPEVILARELGLPYQSVAMVTDYDCWKENEEPVTWEIVMERMKQNAENVKKLLLEVVPRINFDKCECTKISTEVEI
jgi:5'-methylthioadenosine phosphorylase